MVRTMIMIGMLAGLAACSSMPSAGSSSGDTHSGGSQPAAGASGNGDMVCDSAPVLSLVGKTLTPDLVETARTRSHSGTTRVLHPGEVMTMEYNPARLNIILDKQNKIITIHCG
jgi:hypothetical protein